LLGQSCISKVDRDEHSGRGDTVMRNPDTSGTMGNREHEGTVGVSRLAAKVQAKGESSNEVRSTASRSPSWGTSDWMLGWSSFGLTPIHPRWEDEFLNVAESLGRSLGWSYTHIGFSYSDKSKTHLTWEGKTIAGSRHKTWKYSSRALAKLREASTKEDLKSIEFIWAGPDDNLNIGARAELSFSTIARQEPCKLTLVTEARLLPQEMSAREVAMAILLAFENVMHQDYARIDWRSRGKVFPFAYNQFGHEPDPGSDQDVLFEVFGDAEQYGALVRNKLREVHWGNILSQHGNLRREALHMEIRNLVGDENTVALPGGRLFFCLPIDPRKVLAYDREISLWRRRLRRELAQYSIFL